MEKSSRQILNFEKYANEFTSTLHKNVAREIVHEAWERFNVTVDYDLSLWLVKLLSISPNRYIRANSSFEHADIDNLIGKCLEVISGKGTSGVRLDASRHVKQIQCFGIRNNSFRSVCLVHAQIQMAYLWRR